MKGLAQILSVFGVYELGTNFRYMFLLYCEAWVELHRVVGLQL